MGKTRKYVPELRIRRPYRREPKLRVNVPMYEPFDILDKDLDETDLDDGHSDTSDREVSGE